jgi:chromosome segregation ATPase
MSDSRETQRLDGVEVLSRLIDNVQKSVDAGNVETRARLEKIETSIGDLKKVDASLGDRVSEVHQDLVALRSRVERLEDDRNTDRRTRDEDRDARDKEREAIITHVARLESHVSTLEAAVGETKAEVAKTNEGVGAIVNELGLEDRVALGREVKPGEPQPQRALQRLDDRAKRSTIVQALIAIGIILELLARHWPGH